MQTQQSQLFTDMAHAWWDPEGPMQLLHVMNPLRVHFIKTQTQKPNATVRVLDVGCGAGILSEALASEGYDVLGIDPNETLIKTAMVHGQQHNNRACYQNTTAKAFLDTEPKTFDIVVCSEVLEHAEDPQALFHTCQQLLKPNGHLVITTINQTPTAFFKAIVAAEYLFKWLPKGTHHYEGFIKPSTLNTWARKHNQRLTCLKGLEVNPWQKTARISPKVDMQYMACFQ